MVVAVYDSFLDPANWPDDLERRRLAALYGWRNVAPRQDPPVRIAPKRKARRGNSASGIENLARPTRLELVTFRSATKSSAFASSAN